MKIPMLHPLKTIALTVAALCVAAIALGRMSAPTPHLRSVEPVRFVAIASGRSSMSDSTPGFLDLETGEVKRLDLSEGDALASPAISPWQDERGQREVVGRWLKRSGRGEDRVTTEFGLARFSFPDGEAINRVATDILPEGTPCWYPGTTGKILFAAADGALYRFKFEGSTALDASPEGCDPRPIPIVWKVAPPGTDERSVRIADPIWPEGRGFGGRVIVSLRIQIRSGRDVTLSPPRLWSLKLDAEGGAIEAASPLAADDLPDSSVDVGVKVRCPRADRTHSGANRIAFLSRRQGQSGWDLKAANVVLDEEGAPKFESRSETLNLGLSAFAAPAFSADGRWVYYLPADPRAIGIHRVPSGADLVAASR